MPDMTISDERFEAKEPMVFSDQKFEEYRRRITDPDYGLTDIESRLLNDAYEEHHVRDRAIIDNIPERMAQELINASNNLQPSLERMTRRLKQAGIDTELLEHLVDLVQNYLRDLAKAAREAAEAAKGATPTPEGS